MSEEVSANYGIEEHRHRFAVWAAARAAQRNFTSVDNLRKALEGAGVREFVRKCDVDLLEQATFETEHRAMCNRIMTCLLGMQIKKVTFGRAAKLFAVYLKSVVILGQSSDCTLSRIAHPPIDNILLRNLARSKKPGHKKEWAKIKWTTLGDADYYKLIAQLRATLPPGAPFWMLERHWTVTSKAEEED